MEKQDILLPTEKNCHYIVSSLKQMVRNLRFIKKCISISFSVISLVQYSSKEGGGREGGGRRWGGRGGC